MNFHRFAVFLVVFCALANAATPSTSSDDVVLAENKHTKLTLADYRAELLSLPPEMRDAFATDPRRVAQLLNNLLTIKTLAAQAREAGIDRDDETKQRLALETERLLAQIEVQRIEQKAAAEFDARGDQLTPRAREIYLVEQKKYTRPPQVRVAHILFDTSRGDEAALAAAKGARAKLAAGADFATLAKELSDDPGSKAKGGLLDWFGEGRMDPAFTKAAFALTKEGEISEPVKSQFGYHLIRLEGRRPAEPVPFEQVRPQIIADMRTQYINEQRDAAVNAIRNDPATKPNQPAIDALVKRPVAAAPGK